jgi:molybdopterin converting factor small subunit
MAHVILLGGLRRVAGRARVAVEADTVGSLLASLEMAIGREGGAALCRDGGLQPDVEVLVNGRHIQFLAGLGTPLGPEDQVTIFQSGLRGFPGG